MTKLHSKFISIPTQFLLHCDNALLVASYPFLIYKVRVKKFVPNKIGDIGMEVYYLNNPTPISLLVNLVSSSDGHDIGVGVT